MPDLFNTPDPTPTTKKKYYKAKDGKFTDKETAKIDELRKDRDKFKFNFEYWKTQAERLSREVYQEKNRANTLQAQINSLTKNGN